MTTQEELILSRAFTLFGCFPLCMALGCALGSAPRDGGAELPPVAPDLARIILYMVVANELPSYCPHLTVDGEPVGRLCVGNFLFVDQPPGVHKVNVAVDKNLSAFGEQSATDPLDLKLGRGETGYIQVTALAMSVGVKVVLTPETTADGVRDISSLRLAKRGSAP